MAGWSPAQSDSAIFDAAGSAFTVTSGVSETVRSVRLSSNATLSLTAGTFDALKNGTGLGRERRRHPGRRGRDPGLRRHGDQCRRRGDPWPAMARLMRLEPGAHLQGGTLASAGSGMFVAKAAYVGAAGGHLVVDARLKLMGACTLDGAD